MSASPMNDRALSKRLLLEVSAERRPVYGAMALYLPILLCRIGQPFVIGLAVERGFQLRDLHAIATWTLVFVGLVLCQSATEIVQLFLLQRTGQRVLRNMRERLFAKVQRLPLAYFDRTPLGRVMTRVTNDVESLGELFSSGGVQIVGDVLFLLGTLVALFAVDWRLALASVSTFPVLLFGVQYFRRRARAAFRRVRTQLGTLNGYLQEHLSGMHVVQLFHQTARVRDRFAVENQAYNSANREAIFLDAGVYSFVDAMGTIAVAVVLWMGAGLHEAGWLTLGVLVAFIQALERFFLPIRELSNRYTVMQNAFTSAERIYELEDEPETIQSPPAPKPAVFEHELTFDDVHFRYEKGPPVLQGLSFHVRKGERVAFVGHTGAGKSTILRLFDRAYDIQRGAIRLDGIDIREMALPKLRALSTTVPQDVFLFSGTIRDNLAFARPSLSDAELTKAIAACQAEGVLSRHGGLNGEVKERGQNFSLGERQLLALVRALVTDPPILILDEATASVDRETERRLQLATETLMQGRTALIVAHRLSTIRQCDRIIVMSQGRIVESGSHEELMSRGGQYAALVELQRRAESA